MMNDQISHFEKIDLIIDARRLKNDQSLVFKILDQKLRMQMIDCLDRIKVDTGCTYFDDDCCSYMFRICELSPLVEDFTLIANATCFTKDGVFYLCQGLESFNSLKYLHLNLCCNRRVDKIAAKFLAETLPNLKSLVSLELNLYAFSLLDDTSLKDLANSLSDCNSVKTLSLSIGDSDQITDEGINSLSRAIGSMNLHSLSISLFKLMSITDESCMQLAESISELTTLTDLNIEVYECPGQVTDRTFSKVANILSSLPNMSRLELEFGRSHVTDNSIIELDKNIIHLRQLREFILGLGKTQVTDRSLCPLLRTLRDGEFPDLAEVAFGFDECVGVTNRTAEMIRDLLMNRTTVIDTTLWTWRSSIELNGIDSIHNVANNRRFHHIHMDLC
eukprot:TRINITY_DN3830_c0_g2_i1.p1 TRINITY_DN3830_c0_g2~~TRINITY_DN3830_c0_g2_i1.p1  ORF type:complete len:390 (+),score=33.25 TRINITY_DN3830_c0_g2_i1:281-1450(+)